MMIDGNSAAERQHSAAQERAEALHDAYGERVIQDIVDDVLGGKKVCGKTLHDFLEEKFDYRDIAAFLLVSCDDRFDMKARWEATAIREIRNWCDKDGADYVAERVRSCAEDDETRYRERD